MIYYAKRKGISFIKVATNGMHLTSSNIRKTLSSRLDYLSISLDGATQETYEKFRVRGSLKKVVSGTRNLVNARNAYQSNLKIENYEREKHYVI